VFNDPSDTCWTVLRAASRGNDAARDSFTRSYATAIRGYLAARWRGHILESEADDATQDVLMECLKPGGALERADAQRGQFRGFLFGIARNVALRFEARALARGRILDEDSAWLQHVASDEPGQATIFDRSWAQALVRHAKRLHRKRALADGPAGERRLELLERRFGGNEAIREIAAAWAVPAQDVHNAYRKARTEFYECLREVVSSQVPVGADLDLECRRLLAQLH